MGQQARLKRLRREQRLQDVESSGRRSDEPMHIIRSLHRSIQQATSENGRRCWEYLLEMMAHSSGWQTDTNESRHVWGKLPSGDDRWRQFYESWADEVLWAKRNRAAFSEPLGTLLEEIQANNGGLGQFFTPMGVVRLLNEFNIPDEPLPASGIPTRRALDPSCGSGRFMIDSLVHNDNLAINGVDMDLWMVRCAMLNIRLLAPWTSLRLKDRADILKPFRRGVLAEEFNRLSGERYNANEPESRGGDALVIGGRAIFIHGDSLIVDLGYTPNWLCAGWAWLPKPWQSNLKIDGYPGTYDQWVADGRPPRGEVPADEPVQFDFSMVDKTSRQSP